MKNYKFMLIAVIIISVIAGAAAGFWGGQTYIRYRFHKGLSDSEYLKARILNKLDNLLGLDEKQRASISAILDNGIKEHKGVLKGFRSKMKALRGKRIKEIEKVLTKEQKEKFSEWKEKRKKKWQRRKTRYMKGGDSDEKDS